MIFGDQVALQQHGRVPSWLSGSETVTSCDTMELSPDKQLASIEYLADSTTTILGINWLWTDGTSTKTPSTFSTAKPSKLAIPAGSDFFGFMSGSTSLVNKFSLVYFDNACINTQESVELGGVFYLNQKTPSTVKMLSDISTPGSTLQQTAIVAHGDCLTAAKAAGVNRATDQTEDASAITTSNKWFMADNSLSGVTACANANGILTSLQLISSQALNTIGMTSAPNCY